MYLCLQNDERMNNVTSPSKGCVAEGQVLRKQSNWEGLYFYQKSNVLYQLTYSFTRRFLVRGDRTIDQMVQAARAGKQNIVEGSADGVTSMEMELKLLNVARSSIKELKEDLRTISPRAICHAGLWGIFAMTVCSSFVAITTASMIISLILRNGRLRKWRTSL